MNFQSPCYLPNAEKRLARLRKIIAGRPVAILAAGPSIKELEEKIGELRYADVCYFGINNFFVQENHILKKINKRFSVLIEGGGDEEILPIFDKVTSFLDRDDNNMLVSSLSNLKRLFGKYDEKIFSPYYTGLADRTVPDNDRPLHFIVGNSVSVLIYLATIGKASKIVLFGADGYAANKDAKEIYYRPKEYGGESQKQLIENTNKGFNPIIRLGLRNIYKTHRLEPIPILNCSEVSFLTPFPKVSYNDGFDFLLGKKNIKEISDLRTPTASIIIPDSGDEKEARDTLKNIAEQSYSNYETIVIKRNSSFLDTMKNALFSARGKYIFYCPAGDGYPDRDWVNSCLEILENRPQLSLVCGISENQLTDSPWRKKMFVYYWLKRKSFFPSNIICVRKQILEKCLFQSGGAEKEDTEFESWLNFNLRFNVDGYLPAFISTTAPASFMQDPILYEKYKRKIDNYKYRLIFRKAKHCFRDGDGNILSGKFYLSVFLFCDIAKKLKNKLPRPLLSRLNIARQLVRKFYQK